MIIYSCYSSEWLGSIYFTTVLHVPVFTCMYIHFVLQESLDEVTVKDMLEGDNMYTCSKCQKKVRAEKRSVIIFTVVIGVYDLTKWRQTCGTLNGAYNKHNWWNLLSILWCLQDSGSTCIWVPQNCLNKIGLYHEKSFYFI